MSNKKLVQWAKKKLDEGMNEEKIRKALEKSGRDPEILEEAKRQRNLSKQSEKPQQATKKENQKLGQNKKVSNSRQPAKKQESASSLRDKLSDIQTESVFSKLLTGLKSNIKILGVLLFCMMLISGAWILASSGFLTMLNPANQAGQNSTQVSNPEPASGYSGPTVFLNEGVAKPSRASLSSGEQLRFVNNVSYTLQISFESSDNDFRLEPGATKKKSFNSLVYYKASSVKAADKPSISGSVSPE